MVTAPSRKRERASAKHLTLRNVPPDVMATLARETRRLRMSQNAATIHILRRALGLTNEPYDNGLSRYAGDWSSRDFDEFTAAVAPFERVDEELWR